MLNKNHANKLNKNLVLKVYKQFFNKSTKYCTQNAPPKRRCLMKNTTKLI